MPQKAIFSILLATVVVGSAASDEGQPCGAVEAGEVAGAWRLVEATTTWPDGTVEHPFGQPPAGLFIYTPGGHLSLHLHKNPPPPAFERRPDDAALGLVARGYIGYYGTWSVTDGKIVHHISGAMLPNRIGQDAERPFSLCEGVLELSIEGRDGRHLVRRLERVERFGS
jgi:hypothetical protein